MGQASDFNLMTLPGANKIEADKKRLQCTIEKRMPGLLKIFQMIRAVLITTQSLHHMFFKEEEC